ncbi:MAG: DUF3108 domain-containing protein [Crocinitomicaceae bacterium]|nr:DUF3108 domain-containing protein [Crocinitomicaceae bacterium]
MRERAVSVVIAIGIAVTTLAGGDQDVMAESQKEFVKIKQAAFRPGEQLTYRLSYGAFDAGEAVLTVKETDKTVNGRKLWNVRGIGRTISAFEWFYKVDDLYESYIDAEAVIPWLFIRRVDEGGYKINQDYVFHQHKNQVDNGKGKNLTFLICARI